MQVCAYVVHTTIFLCTVHCTFQTEIYRPNRYPYFVLEQDNSDFHLEANVNTMKEKSLFCEPVNHDDTPPCHSGAGASSLPSCLSSHHAYTVSKVCVCTEWCVYKTFIVYRIVTVIVV